jgi:hypothetical protein
VHGFVSVAAENTIDIVLAGVLQRSRGHLRGHTEPTRVEPVDKPGNRLALEIELLQLEIERGANPAEAQVVDLEAIELVAVDREMLEAIELPGIVLVDADADEVRHDVGETVIVIAFHPHDLDISLRVGKFANVAEKLPVIFGETREVEVGEDVTEQNQPLEAGFLQDARGFAGMAGLCTEVQVGKDQRVVDMQIHNLVVARECYEVMKYASTSVQS